LSLFFQQRVGPKYTKVPNFFKVLEKIINILDENIEMDHDCFNMAIRMAVWNQAITLNKQNYQFMDLKFVVSSYLLLLQNCFRIVYMLKYNCVKVKLCKKYWLFS
jgi:hypothetical protein